MFKMSVKSKMASQMGNEKRFSILPTKDPGDPGFLGPNYDPSDYIPLPGQLGVRRGSSLGAAVDSLRAVSYYVDTIGFGQKSLPFTSNRRPVYIYGINYFMRTGIKCSNGADMYQYVETIPKGDALGKNVQRGLISSGLPQLRGLAPGALEDAKAALNPVPIVKSLFGSGYAKCTMLNNMVGDMYGRTGDENGSWIQGPMYPIWNPATRRYVYNQSHWVAQTDSKGDPIMISKDEYDQTPKTHNPDGSPKTEGFNNQMDKPLLPLLFAGALALGGMAVLKIMASK
jgi:hypothetical protein